VLAAPGQSAIEIRRMIGHGLSVTEALVSATSGGAYALGFDAHAGTVEPGKRADLLLLDRDPLERPELLSKRERVWLVIQHGTPVADAALEPAFDEVRSCAL
jgi:imidazolonepropionase-like amidohydrolase